YLEGLDVERLFQLDQHLVDDTVDLLRIVERRHQQQKLVAADARQHVAAAQALDDPLGDLDQQRVADGVAVIVVDVLEIIEINEGQRKARRVAVAQQLFDALLNQHAVRQSGQSVEISAPRQLVLDVLAVGDVVRSRHQKRPVVDVHGL